MKLNPYLTSLTKITKDTFLDNVHLQGEERMKGTSREEFIDQDRKEPT